MRNQPHSQWQVIDSAAERRESVWSLDQQVELRTWLLGGIVLLALMVISWRITDLKAHHQQSYLKNAHPVTVETEPIPAVDGRIYSSDGLLLAYDHKFFNIAVHYRWLEEPPHPRWLREQTRKMQERALESEAGGEVDWEAQVLEQRNQLWQRLAEAGRMSMEEFEQRRAGIQSRVEKIAATVNRKRTERLQGETRDKQMNTGSWKSWEDVWRLIKNELTEPPRRNFGELIVIKEELDYHAIIKEVPTNVVAEIEAHPSDYPGVKVSPSSTRLYPHGDLASHVIGLRSSLREDQIRERRKELDGKDPLAYAAGDRRGRFGVEKSYDSTLHGLSGARRVSRRRDGEIDKIEPIRSSRSGNHLVLSLNSQLQKLAEELLDEQIPPEPSLVPPLPDGLEDPTKTEPNAGCILLMNVYSGELLAAASSPRPDLSRLADNQAKYWRQLTSDDRAPLLSRITQVALPPGSTFKPVTAIALCESEGIPRKPFHCQGFLDDPFSHRCAIFQLYGVGHEEIDLVGALAQSCNVYFFNAARKMGAVPLSEWSRRLGFGQITNVDLPLEKSGHVPSPRDNAVEGSYQWYEGDTLGLAIGQSYLTVTPLQMLAMTAAIANGGGLITPRVVSRIMTNDDNGEGEDIVPPVKSQQLELSAETLQVIREGMQQTVAGPQGTGRKTVYLPEVSIAGKTGTAQTGGNRGTHAWFVGYVPVERPQYAFVVMLEEGGSGGADAGPLARKMVEGLLQFGFVEPDKSE